VGNNESAVGQPLAASPFRQKATSPRYRRLGARQPIPSRTDQQNELHTIGITRTASGHTGPTRRTARSRDLSSATSRAKKPGYAFRLDRLPVTPEVVGSSPVTPAPSQASGQGSAPKVPTGGKPGGKRSDGWSRFRFSASALPKGLRARRQPSAPPMTIGKDRLS
jgi:hypothetical protein